MGSREENGLVGKGKALVGLGFLVQGLRCLPWMGVNFFLKDTLRVHPSTLQLLQNSVNLPMVAKPLYGVVSDAVYIRGQHRIPYIAIGESGEPPPPNQFLNSGYFGYPAETPPSHISLNSNDNGFSIELQPSHQFVPLTSGESSYFRESSPPHQFSQVTPHGTSDELEEMSIPPNPERIDEQVLEDTHNLSAL